MVIVSFDESLSPDYKIRHPIHPLSSSSQYAHCPYTWRGSLKCIPSSFQCRFWVIDRIIAASDAMVVAKELFRLWWVGGSLVVVRSSVAGSSLCACDANADNIFQTPSLSSSSSVAILHPHCTEPSSLETHFHEFHKMCLQKRKLKILLVNNKILWGRCTRPERMTTPICRWCGASASAAFLNAAPSLGLSLSLSVAQSLGTILYYSSLRRRPFVKQGEASGFGDIKSCISRATRRFGGGDGMVGTMKMRQRRVRESTQRISTKACRLMHC